MEGDRILVHKPDGGGKWGDYVITAPTDNDVGKIAVVQPDKCVLWQYPKESISLCEFSSTEKVSVRVLGFSTFIVPPKLESYRLINLIVGYSIPTSSDAYVGFSLFQTLESSDELFSSVDSGKDEFTEYTSGFEDVELRKGARIQVSVSIVPDPAPLGMSLTLTFGKT